MNCGPLSEISESWSPKHLNTWWRKSLATPAASMVLEQGVRITPFIRPWLTMTINELWPFEGGRSVMRSTDSCLKDRGEDEGMGVSGGRVGWWLILFCWHMVHPAIKVLTKEESPGHQKSCSRSALVRNHPTCPVVGESCMERTMACCLCGGMYM